MTRTFLLGGHDLEMVEIRKMLNLHGERVIDYRLNWSNARLSAYSDVMDAQPDVEYYGIELQEDRPLPAHYIRIDHHNDYNDRPATILQVAALLHIAPDRHMQLVAANDSGYIPALKSFGASTDEILKIRLMDRAAQGVTAEDERLAEQSIKYNLTTLKGIQIVKSLTPRFSPICDRLFPYQRLLIYNDSEWIYYGDGKEALTKELATDITRKRIYHGGGSQGYIGAAKGVFSSQEIHDFVTLIMQRYEHI